MFQTTTRHLPLRSGLPPKESQLTAMDICLLVLAMVLWIKGMGV
jgi:hypothetical protein